MELAEVFETWRDGNATETERKQKIPIPDQSTGGNSRKNKRMLIISKEKAH
jgi:hypothetical protein